ncbi:MAG: diaminopimelate decarboxylase [Calditrichae bacterium]|nr:diaminopimelate decarboxylase [Calditrichia bacterium]
MSNPFQFKNNRLFCEDVDIENFAKTVPTPFYLYSKSEIISNCQSVWDAAAGVDFQPCYALKANYNPTLLKIIRENGFGADIVSGGELFFAEKAGFPADSIVFAGVGKTDSEISMAIKAGIHSINIESAQEMYKVAELAGQLSRKQRIAIRVNPDIEAKTHEYISTGLHTNKFGVSTEEAYNLYLETKKFPQLIADSIHVHIGSQITEESPYLATADFLKSFINKLENQGISIKGLDLGGGIGINYSNALTDKNAPRTYINEILPHYIKAFGSLKVRMFVELGRAIIGSAGLLISKVLIRKETPLKKFMIVDAAMNNLIRPSLYQAKHEIVPVKNTQQKKIKADIVGPVCESGDFLAKNLEIEDLSAGEFIAVGGAGAYGQSQSTNYNLRPTIAEYLVDGSDIKCIFKGRSIQQIAENFEW